MKKGVFITSVKKTCITLAVLTVCGISFVGEKNVYAGINNSDVTPGDYIIIGKNNYWEDNKDVVFVGVGNNVTGNKGVAFGYDNTASGDNSTAIGSGSKATANGATAIGNGSIADEANTVSVGRAGATKRITNVSEAVKDTDAVNKGQFDKAINAVDNKVKANADNIKKNAADIATNKTNIGELSNLDTDIKGANTVEAINRTSQKVGKISALHSDIKADNSIDAINNVNIKVGNLNDLDADIKGASTVEAINNVNRKFNDIDNKIHKSGANAAALAALHPMDFDPDEKLNFAAGCGNYRGANAFALGAFYRPSEKVMFSVAGSMGNGENMVNLGVTFALDRNGKTTSTTSKTLMAKKLAQQERDIEAQNVKIAQLEAMVKQLSTKLK